MQIKLTEDDIVKGSVGRRLVVDQIIRNGKIKAMVQVKKKNVAMRPPIALDTAFKKALRLTINAADSWGQVHDNDGNPTTEFIKNLISAYDHESAGINPNVQSIDKV